jgi:O-antigen/teichoic acid export membrane protein
VARGEQLFAAGEYLGNHAASHWRDLIQWGPKAFYALSDQGLFASSNFVLNVLLARWLTPEEYGGFALAFSVFLLLAMAHSALLVEPALIFGPGRYGTRQRWYLHRLVLGHAAVTTGTAVLLCMATFVAWTIGLPTTTAVSLGSLFLASPFILFLGLMRRACYMSSTPRLAASSGLLYLILVLGAVLVLRTASALNPVSAFAVQGVCSVLSGAWLARRLGVLLKTVEGGPSAEIVWAHWQYGRWALASGVLMWLPANIYFVILPAWQSLAATATLKAAGNLVAPILHANGALATLLLPALVRRRDNAREFRRAAGIALGAFTAGGLAYWLFIGLAGPYVTRWLYGGQYAFEPAWFWLLGALPLSGGAGLVFGAVLRARERPDHVFLAYVVTTLCSPVGLALTRVSGITGALTGMLLGSAATAGTMVLLGWVGKTRARR